MQERETVLQAMSTEEAEELLKGWRFWARPKQIAPSWNWRTWLILAGRGWGKTRTGAEWVDERIKGKFCKPCRRIALVAPTAADARDVMVEGESGILAISDEDFMPVYQPSKRRVRWPNGAIATLYSADKPARLRGPQHDAAWSDELAAWRYPEAWDNLQFGLRLGINPQGVVTTTPKPLGIIKDLIEDSGKTVHVTEGTTYENSRNLAPAFLEAIVKKYEGTRLGKQEIYAKILGDVVGALWTYDMFDPIRVSSVNRSKFMKIVVSVDPAASDGKKRRENDSLPETGIVVVGIVVINNIPMGYVLEDVSITGSPNDWAKAAIKAYHDWGANYIIGEANNGGDMVGNTILTIDPTVAFKKVWASKGKYTRAEPVSSLYEQGRIRHLGQFPELEGQMCTWIPGAKSPDRLDAMVWGINETMLDGTVFTDVFEGMTIANDGPFSMPSSREFDVLQQDIFDFRERELW